MTYEQLMLWRQAVGAMPSSNDDYVRGVRKAGDALAARVEVLEAALVEAREIIALCDTPRHISDPRLYQVANELGARHGYSALMQAAAHAWHDATGPLMVPGSEQTCGPCQITVTNALKAIDVAQAPSPPRTLARRTVRVKAMTPEQLRHVATCDGEHRWSRVLNQAADALEEAERVIECADFAFNIFADEPVDSKTAMTETEEILMASRKETNAYLRRRSTPAPADVNSKGGETDG